MNHLHGSSHKISLMSARAPLAAYWCFTWNNYPDDADDIVKNLYDSDVCVYIVYQREVGESTATPHLQGFLILKKRKRLTAMKKLLADQVAWFRCARENVQEKADYCKKEDTRLPDTNPIEYGELTIRSPGSHEPLVAFQEAVKEGSTWNVLLISHGEIMTRCMQYCREFFNVHSPDPEWTMTSNFEERSWHQVVDGYISNPDDRTILFIVDPKGGMGKTTYAKKLIKERDDVQFLKPAKEADLALSLDNSKSIFLMDCPRCRSDIPLPYNILESIKDGLVFSGKYQSCTKRITVPNAVVVFTNDVPDPVKLSMDRFVVKVWRDGKLVPVVNDEGDLKWKEKKGSHYNTSWSYINPETKKRLDEEERAQKRSKHGT